MPICTLTSPPNPGQYSWVSDTFSRYGTACLFDENLARKPTYYSVSSVLAAAATSGSGMSVASSASQTLSGMTTSHIPLSTSTPLSLSSEAPSSSASVVSTLVQDLLLWFQQCRQSKVLLFQAWLLLLRPDLFPYLLHQKTAILAMDRSQSLLERSTFVLYVFRLLYI